MTAGEIKKRYGISAAILKIYEEQVRMRFCHKKAGEKEYDDQELEKISMVMTLKKFGFENQEIIEYFSLEEKGQETKAERIRMLTKRRQSIVEEIHQKEKILGELDYLRYGLM